MQFFQGLFLLEAPGDVADDHAGAGLPEAVFKNDCRDFHGNFGPFLVDHCQFARKFSRPIPFGERLSESRIFPVHDAAAPQGDYFLFAAAQQTAESGVGRENPAVGRRQQHPVEAGFEQKLVALFAFRKSRGGLQH